jgi:hypothetical protein
MEGLGFGRHYSRYRHCFFKYVCRCNITNGVFWPIVINFSRGPYRGPLEKHPKLAKPSVLRLGNFLMPPTGAFKQHLKIET